MLSTADKTYGTKLWAYDSATANCQYFAVWFLGSKATPAVKAFIMQDAEKTLEGMSLLQRAAKVVTDIAATAETVMNGAGLSKKLPKK